MQQAQMQQMQQQFQAFAAQYLQNHQADVASVQGKRTRDGSGNGDSDGNETGDKRTRRS
jgi:hypothetical protein